MYKTEEFENMIKSNFNNLNEVKNDYKNPRIILHDEIQKSGETPSKIGSILGLSNYIYELIDLQSSKIPSRNTLLKIIIYLKLDLKICNELLQKFGHSKLYARVPFDAIILYCIDKKYNIYETHDLLYENNYHLLSLRQQKKK